MRCGMLRLIKRCCKALFIIIMLIPIGYFWICHIRMYVNMFAVRWSSISLCGSGEGLLILSKVWLFFFLLFLLQCQLVVTVSTTDPDLTASASLKWAMSLQKLMASSIAIWAHADLRPIARYTAIWAHTDTESLEGAPAQAGHTRARTPEHLPESFLGSRGGHGISWALAGLSQSPAGVSPGQAPGHIHILSTWKVNAFTCFAASSWGERIVEVYACCVQLVFGKHDFDYWYFYLRFCKFGIYLLCQYHGEFDRIGFCHFEIWRCGCVEMMRGIGGEGFFFSILGYRRGIARVSPEIRELYCLVLPCFVLSLLLLLLLVLLFLLLLLLLLTFPLPSCVRHKGHTQQSSLAGRSGWQQPCVLEANG